MHSPNKGARGLVVWELAPPTFLWNARYEKLQALSSSVGMRTGTLHARLRFGGHVANRHLCVTRVPTRWGNRLSCASGGFCLSVRMVGSWGVGAIEISSSSRRAALGQVRMRLPEQQLARRRTLPSGMARVEAVRLQQL